MSNEVWGRNGCRGPLNQEPVPPVKTGKLTGEAAGKGVWQLTRFLAGLSGGGIRGGFDLRVEGMLPASFADPGGGFLLSVSYLDALMADCWDPDDFGVGAGAGR